MQGKPSAGRELRRAAKVLLVDQQMRVLLFHGGDPGTSSDDSWWFPTGGGLDPGESVVDAARREVFEETGLVLSELGPVRFRRQTDITFNGNDLRLDEDYFVVRVDHFDVDDAGWTDLERQVMIGHRWWTMDELTETTETVYPAELVDIIANSL